MKRHTALFISSYMRACIGFVIVFCAWPFNPIVNAQDDADAETYNISPFVIEESSNTGYLASQTLAGSRLRTDLRNIGSSIQVVTQEFMDDIGATGIEELLQYTTNTEVGGSLGNFTGVDQGSTATSTQNARGNPDGTTRVRGLAAPDRTRNFYKTDIPFDSYNTDRIDINRGANSFLFGLGSPAGLINNGMSRAYFENTGELEVRIGSGGDRPSWRVAGNFNKELIEDTVALKFAFLNDSTQYRQQPTFKDDERFYVALTVQPFKNPNTVIRAYFESGKIDGNAPDVLGPQENLSTFLDDPNYAAIYGKRSIDVMANMRNFNHVEGPNANFDNPLNNPDGLPIRNTGGTNLLRDIRLPVNWGFLYDGRNGEDPTMAFQTKIFGSAITNGDPFFDPHAPKGKGNIDWGAYPGNYGEIYGIGSVDKGFTDLKTFDFSKNNWLFRNFRVIFIRDSYPNLPSET